MKIKAITTGIVVAILVTFNLLLSYDICNDTDVALALMPSINSAQAEVIGEVTTRYFWGFPDKQRCTYYENTYTGVIKLSLDVGLELGGTWTARRGTRTICDNTTEDRCDYLACGP